MATISVQTNKRRWRMDIRKTMPLMTMSGGESTKIIAATYDKQ